ncbi:MAG: carbohydrate kinase family protein, partial [Bryobacteraceae bacterium]
MQQPHRPAEQSPAVAHVDVSGIGVNATDTVIRLPHFPALNSKVEIQGCGVYPGGQVASALVACQAWGLRTRYVGKVGDDGAADLQRAEFARTGVEAHLFAVPHCASQVSFVLNDQGSGERTILWRRDSRLDMDPKEMQPEWFQNSKALLLDGHDTPAAIVAARWARERGVPVIGDVDNL